MDQSKARHADQTQRFIQNINKYRKTPIDLVWFVKHSSSLEDVISLLLLKDLIWIVENYCFDSSDCIELIQWYFFDAPHLTEHLENLNWTRVVFRNAHDAFFARGPIDCSPKTVGYALIKDLHKQHVWFLWCFGQDNEKLCASCEDDVNERELSPDHSRRLSEWTLAKNREFEPRQVIAQTMRDLFDYYPCIRFV